MGRARSSLSVRRLRLRRRARERRSAALHGVRSSRHGRRASLLVPRGLPGRARRSSGSSARLLGLRRASRTRLARRQRDGRPGGRASVRAALRRAVPDPAGRAGRRVRRQRRPLDGRRQHLRLQLPLRRRAGPRRWSAHAYGEAIDVNPVENPYLEEGASFPRREPRTSTDTACGRAWRCRRQPGRRVRRRGLGVGRPLDAIARPPALLLHGRLSAGCASRAGAATLGSSAMSTARERRQLSSSRLPCWVWQPAAAAAHPRSTDRAGEGAGPPLAHRARALAPSTQHALDGISVSSRREASLVAPRAGTRKAARSLEGYERLLIRCSETIREPRPRPTGPRAREPSYALGRARTSRRASAASRRSSASSGAGGGFDTLDPLTGAGEPALDGPGAAEHGRRTPSTASRIAGRLRLGRMPLAAEFRGRGRAHAAAGAR